MSKFGVSDSLCEFTHLKYNLEFAYLMNLVSFFTADETYFIQSNLGTNVRETSSIQFVSIKLNGASQVSLP